MPANADVITRGMRLRSIVDGTNTSNDAIDARAPTRSGAEVRVGDDTVRSMRELALSEHKSACIPLQKTAGAYDHPGIVVCGETTSKTT